MNLLSNKIAVINGAASGMGEAIAVAYAEQGAKLCLFDINATNLNRVKEKINQKTTDCECYVVDITNKQELKEAFQKISATFGKVDILVNAAGIWKATPILQMQDEEMDRMMEVNFKGHYNCIKLVLPDMVEKKEGKIISIVSVAGKAGSGVSAHYAASKGAGIAFTKSLARELGSYGINVNAISPGLIDTPMGRSTGEYGAKTYLERCPLGRMGKAEDVAELAVYLGSANSNYITGQVWNVCGGYLMD